MPGAAAEASAKLEFKRGVWSAVRSGNVEKVQIYANDCAVRGPFVDDIFSNRQGWTLIHECVERGHSGTLLTLCAKFGDVNRAKKNGLRPVDVAAAKGNLPMLFALERLGADVRVESKSAIIKERDDAVVRCKKIDDEVQEIRRQSTEASAQLREVAKSSSEAISERDELRARVEELERQQASHERDREMLARLRESPDLKALIGDPPPKQCCVCMERPANTLLLPCKHTDFCYTCASEVMSSPPPRCPMCRTPVTSLPERLPGFPD